MENNTICPSFLYELLQKQYGEDLTKEIIDGYSINRITSLRINPLKGEDFLVLEEFDSMGIEYEKYEPIPHAYILKNANAKMLYDTALVKEGKIYFQSLSSMLPPLFLDPKENEAILDMAAAPGGKTTLIAALTNNKVQITACEVNKIRYERLKYNLDKQGVKNCIVLNQDAKRLDDYFSFDKILLDAPCSGSGTLDFNNPKALKAFSLELVKNSSKLQLELLRKALKILKPNHEIIYSTCSILDIENENVLTKVLKEYHAEIVPIEFPNLPLLPTKIPGTILVRPNKYFEGFFIAKIRKKG